MSSSKQCLSVGLSFSGKFLPIFDIEVSKVFIEYELVNWLCDTDLVLENLNYEEIEEFL